MLAVTTTVMDRKARIASLGLPPVDGAPDPLGVNPTASYPPTARRNTALDSKTGNRRRRNGTFLFTLVRAIRMTMCFVCRIDQRGSKRTVPRLTGEPPVLTNAISAQARPGG